MSGQEPLRIFILPSWSPSKRAPHNGIFFLQQATALARLRPDWTVGIVWTDLESSRFGWRWNAFTQFCLAFCTEKRLAVSRSAEGLYAYNVWRPWQRYIPFTNEDDKMADALTSQAEIALRAFIAEHGTPHVIHGHAATPGGTAAARLGKKYAIPVVITEHMAPFPWPKHRDAAGQPIALIHEAYAGARACVAVSASLARSLRGFNLAEDVRVIPNLVDECRFTIAPKQPGPGVFSLLSVGWPSERKGTDILLRALATLDGNLTLAVVGDTPERPLYEQLANKLGIADRVRWLGNVHPAHMPELYQACSAFVLPSRAETFGVSYVEALMCGKAVIATACGGPEEIVTAQNGLLVPVDDIQGLADAVQHLRGNLSDYQPLPIREDAVWRFGTQAVITKLEALYREIIAHEPLGTP